MLAQNELANCHTMGIARVYLQSMDQEPVDKLGAVEQHSTPLSNRKPHFSNR